MLACHAGGRGFESRPLRHFCQEAPAKGAFVFGHFRGALRAACRRRHRHRALRRGTSRAKLRGLRPRAPPHAAETPRQDLRLDRHRDPRPADHSLRLLRHRAVHVAADRRLGRQGRSAAGVVAAAPAWWPVSMLWRTRRNQRRANSASSFERARQQQRQQQGENFDAARVRQRRQQARDPRRADRPARAEAGLRRAPASWSAMRRCAKTIQEIPAFQVDGKFNPERYQLALASQMPARRAAVRARSARRACSSRMLADAASRVGVRHRLRNRSPAQAAWPKTRDVACVQLPAPAPDTGAVSAQGDRDVVRRASPPSTARRKRSTIEYVEIDANAARRRRPADEATLRRATSRKRRASSAASSASPRTSWSRCRPTPMPPRRRPPKRRRRSSRPQAKAPGADFAALARANSRRRRFEGKRRRPGLGREGRDGKAVRGRRCSRCRPARSAARSRPSSAGT